MKVTEDLTGVLFFPFVLGNTFESVDIDNQHRLKEKFKKLLRSGEAGLY